MREKCDEVVGGIKEFQMNGISFDRRDLWQQVIRATYINGLIQGSCGVVIIILIFWMFK